MSDEFTSPSEKKEPAVVKPSPFDLSGNKRYHQDVSTSDSTWQIIHVKPDQASFDGGIFIRLTGKIESVAASTLFERTTPHAKIFIKATKPFMRVVFLHDADGQKVLNDKGYQVKGLMFFQSKEATEEQCKQFVEGTFLPALKNYNHAYENPAPDDMFPVEHEEPYVVKKIWTEIMMERDIYYAINSILAPANQCKGTKAYFQKCQAHVYSTWNVGAVPIAAMLKFRLQKMHLHEDDYNRLTIHQNQKTEAKPAATTQATKQPTVVAGETPIDKPTTETSVDEEVNDPETEEVNPTDLTTDMAGEKNDNDVITSSDEDQPISTLAVKKKGNGRANKKNEKDNKKKSTTSKSK